MPVGHAHRCAHALVARARHAPPRLPRLGSALRYLRHNALRFRTVAVTGCLPLVLPLVLLRCLNAYAVLWFYRLRVAHRRGLLPRCVLRFCCRSSATSHGFRIALVALRTLQRVLAILRFATVAHFNRLVLHRYAVLGYVLPAVTRTAPSLPAATPPAAGCTGSPHGCL